MNLTIIIWSNLKLRNESYGLKSDTNLVEVIEIPSHKWFVGVQFHPEYSSTVLKPHPLFVAFVKAALGK